MDKSISYSAIEDISPLTKWEAGQKFCLRIVTNDFLFLFQVNYINQSTFYESILIFYIID
jgi:hypothetical protein